MRTQNIIVYTKGMKKKLRFSEKNSGWCKNNRVTVEPYLLTQALFFSGQTVLQGFSPCTQGTSSPNPISYSFNIRLKGIDFLIESIILLTQIIFFSNVGGKSDL